MKRLLTTLLALTMLISVVSNAPASAAVTVKCDTKGTVTVWQHSDYTLKVTVNGGSSAPVLSVGNKNVFQTQFVSKKGNDFLFKITAVGAPGDSTGVYVSVSGQKPVLQFVATVKPIHYSNGSFQKYGDYLYYDYDRCLYRMKMDGSGKTKVLDVNVSWEDNIFAIDNNTVYYVDEQTKQLYQISLNGGNKKKLSNEPVFDLTAYDHRIYYLSGDYCNAAGTLSCFDPSTGANGKFAPISGTTRYYRIVDGTVYYSATPLLDTSHSTGVWFNADSKLESVQLDGSNPQDYGDISGSLDGFAVQGNFLYFIENDDYKGNLMRCDLSNHEETKLADDIYRIQAITPDWIFASNFGDCNIRVNLSSGDKMELKSMEFKSPASFQVIDSSLYISNGLDGRRESYDTNAVAGIWNFDLNGKLISRLTVSEWNDRILNY